MYSILELDLNLKLLFNNNTVKSHFKALGLYNFIRGFGWAYKEGGGGGGGLYPGGLISRIKKIVWNDEIKRTCI